ncbi:MAG: hypothetical protein LBG95_08100 [Treponema sp.]|jgi:hypothetical protein|nr:hypothetical protein [Treponema sp.]
MTERLEEFGEDDVVFLEKILTALKNSGSLIIEGNPNTRRIAEKLEKKGIVKIKKKISLGDTIVLIDPSKLKELEICVNDNKDNHWIR